MSTWIEKTYPSKRIESEFTKLLLSPTVDAGGRNVYKNMLQVKPLDIIFHIDQDKNELIGYSMAISCAKKIEIDGYNYYEVVLDNFIAFDKHISIDKVLSEPSNQEALCKIKESKQETFMQKRNGKFMIKQGGYLTRCSDELKSILVGREIIELLGAEIDIEYNKRYSEGAEKIVIHKKRERNIELIQNAKSKFKQENNGRLFCECCGFDFFETYGFLGEDFIEGHHKVPISTLLSEHNSTVEDIILLCSNCHRMVHREPNIDISKVKQVIVHKRNN
jgi:hypothetical protein